MTAPLYDVKSRFSEYVTMAEDGEVIEVTKHGVPTVVIVSRRAWDEANEDYTRRNRPSFMESLRKWREENQDCLGDEFAEILEKLHEEEKNEVWPEENPWE